jgi:hypothetical protein
MLNSLPSYLAFLSYAVIAAGQLITMSTGTAHAAMLDELKGLSVQVDYTSDISVRSADDPTYRRRRLQNNLKLYIGLKGTVFEYLHTADNSEVISAKSQVSTVNRAQERKGSHHLLIVWTIDGEILMKIVQLASGFNVVSLRIDPDKLICTFDEHDEPDATTGRILAYSRTGQLLETGNNTLVSYTCEVSRGNIFATDQ